MSDRLMDLIKPKAPERIYGWLDSQLSIARHYGGMTYQGHSYTIAHNEEGQPLVRVDVLARESHQAKEAAKQRSKADKQAADDAQGGLL